MATVRLGRYELEEYDLPRVCMRCGARARHWKTKKFSWYPPWAFIVLGLIGAMMFMKTITMDVPLCERHKWHWGGRTAIIVLGLVGIIFLMFAGIAAADVVRIDPPVVFIPIAMLFLAWLIATVVLSAGTIRPTEITDKSVTLRGVSEEFVEAVREARRGGSEEDEDEEDDRPRRRRARIVDEDDDRPRARRRDRDDEEDDGGYYDPDRRGRVRRDEEDDR
jgi:hypothetical protein